MSESPLRTAVAVMLDDAAPEIAAARAELDPAGAVRIGLHLTLLYPFVPHDEVTPELVEGLLRFFANRAPLEFSLVRLTEFPDVVAYVAPEPQDELKKLMCNLWERYPETPPYGGAFEDTEPVPHATIASYARAAVSLDQVRARLMPLLPVPCSIGAASLLEEHEPERWRELEPLLFGASV